MAMAKPPSEVDCAAHATGVSGSLPADPSQVSAAAITESSTSESTSAVSLLAAVTLPSASMITFATSRALLPRSSWPRGALPMMGTKPSSSPSAISSERSTWSHCVV